MKEGGEGKVCKKKKRRHKVNGRPTIFAISREDCIKEKPRTTMGKAKKTRKFAVAKKIISPKDTRVKSVAAKAAEKKEKEAKKAEPRQVEQGVSALFFQYNTQLGK